MSKVEKPQLSDAEFEVVCWNSTSALFIGVSDEIATQVKVTFTDTISFGDFKKSQPEIGAYRENADHTCKVYAYQKVTCNIGNLKESI